MSPLVLGLLVLLVLCVLYYFLVIRNHVAKLKLYKPAQLINSQSANDSTYQIAQIVITDLNGASLTAADLKFIIELNVAVND